MEKKLQKAIDLEKETIKIISKDGDGTPSKRLLSFCHNKTPKWDILDPFYAPSEELAKLALDSFSVDFYKGTCNETNINEDGQAPENNGKQSNSSNRSGVLIFNLLDAIFSVVLEDNSVVDKAFLLLHDLVLFKIYTLLDESGHCSMYHQLNMCIVLDKMRVKPQDIDFPTLLNETTEKIRSSLHPLDYQVVWAVAMLNYRTHKYDAAIDFFKKYLELGGKDKEFCSRVIDSKIYIGYCYEKQEDFNKAIRLFEELKKQIENDKTKDADSKQSVLDEIYHGLGHFYNERAVFGNTQPSAMNRDLLDGRYHMRKAIASKSDYYSCYGSMFHEYGDYERADVIFDEALKLPSFSSKNELYYEMMFYMGQTKSAIGEGDIADDDYSEFEKYCSSTFNEDGIVHARLFRIRNELRKTSFVVDYDSKREQIRKNIRKWKKDLTAKKLSEYASEEIIKEYDKTQCILDVFSALYADPQFSWHSEDLLYYLRRFVSFIHSSRLLLDYSDKEECSIPSDNMYQVKIGNVWIWCIGGHDANRLIESATTEFFAKIDLPIDFLPVYDSALARKRICINKKPDMIILLPPKTKEKGFDKEIQVLVDAMGTKAKSESSFLLIDRGNQNNLYSKDYFINNWKIKISHKDSEIGLLQFAFCMRSLEILKQELLKPIPLFSLAPTHFSAAYNYQLGKEVSLLSDLINFNYNSNEEKRQELVAFIRSVDTKFESKWDDRETVKSILQSIDKPCCYDEGCFVACFPLPEEDPVENINYISFYCLPQNTFRDIPFGIVPGKKQTTKALPCYNEIFNKVKNFMQSQKSCPKQEKQPNVRSCFCYSADDLSADDVFSKDCRILLENIFGRGLKPGKAPYKCILRKAYEKGHGVQTFIYLIVGKNDLTNTPATETAKNANGGVDSDNDFQNPIGAEHTTVQIQYNYGPIQVVEKGNGIQQKQ